MRGLRRARRIWEIALTAVVLTGAPAMTQSVLAPSLKAAYLLNFVRFIEWPAAAAPASEPLILCVINDAVVASAVEETIKGRVVAARPLALVRLEAGATLPMCHVVYLSASDQKRSLEVTDGLNGKMVLTVSDIPNFAKTGGMVELFVEGGRMRIAVNVDALQRAKVRLSSRVLALATIVRDAPTQ